MFLCKVSQEIVVILAYSKITPYAFIGVYKHLLAFRLSRKMISEAGEGLGPGRDQGICEKKLVNCQVV